jgi:periplasmic protein TonB
MSNPKARRSIAVSLSFERPRSRLPTSPWLKWGGAGSALLHLAFIVLLLWQPMWRRFQSDETDLPVQVEIVATPPAPPAPPAPPPKPQAQPQPKPLPSSPPPPPTPPPKAEPAVRQELPTPEIRLNPDGATAPPTVHIDNPLADVSLPPLPGAHGDVGTGLITIVILLHIRPDGSVATADIARSSGVQQLDEAALQKARGLHFPPVLQDGHPVAAEKREVFNFFSSDNE